MGTIFCTHLRGFFPELHPMARVDNSMSESSLRLSDGSFGPSSRSRQIASLAGRYTIQGVLTITCRVKRENVGKNCVNWQPMNRIQMN